MIKVYTGTMKSSKSSKLISDIKLAKQNKINILVLSSNFGFREHKYITSRDGSKAEAIGINSFSDVVTLLSSEEYNKVTKVFIDEAQFLPNELDPVIEMVKYSIINNINITISGLDLNCFGKPFGVMQILLCYADKVTKFKGYCDKCKHEESSRVLRHANGVIDRDESNVFKVDTKNKELKYMSLCSSCFADMFYK